MEYKVVEMFSSINGEGPLAGQLAYFVRFQLCNLSCTYCDTKWANTSSCPYTLMSTEDIVNKIKESGIHNVTLTGGEPMLQERLEDLIKRLYEEGQHVEIETNGTMSIADYKDKPYRPSFTLDYKTPTSGMEMFMNLSNYEYLEAEDTVKFVCGSLEDLETARTIIKDFELDTTCHVYLSCVFGKLDPKDVVEYMVEHKMNHVNLQLQMHKFIWDPDKKGV